LCAYVLLRIFNRARENNSKLQIRVLSYGHLTQNSSSSTILFINLLIHYFTYNNMYESRMLKKTLFNKRPQKILFLLQQIMISNEYTRPCNPNYSLIKWTFFIISFWLPFTVVWRWGSTSIFFLADFRIQSFFIVFHHFNYVKDYYSFVCKELYIKISKFEILGQEKHHFHHTYFTRE